MQGGFEVIGDIRAIETIAVGGGIACRRRLGKLYGRGHWRKMKGVETVREVTMHEDLEKRFVVCVTNVGYEASLERNKVYAMLVDPDISSTDMRIIDESGEDYLYPAEWFVPVDVPERVRESVIRSASVQ